MTARAKFDGATLAVITARLTGSDTACTACAEGISVTSPSPVIALCRKLIERGYDPALPLVAVRGQTVCAKAKADERAA